MLTMAGLLVAGGPVLVDKVTPVSIWALNFALMFALAFGIDYAPFLVVRFRSAMNRRHAIRGDRETAAAAFAETMATAGKPVVFSAITVVASLASILLVPSPAFRSMALGINLSVVAVLAATFDAASGSAREREDCRVDAGQIRLGKKSSARPHPHGHRLEERPHAWGRSLWRHPLIGAAGGLGILALTVVSSDSAPLCRRSPLSRPPPMLAWATTRLFKPSGPARRALSKSSCPVPKEIEQAQSWPAQTGSFS
jgi:RND superfamily putative drug exporter